MAWIRDSTNKNYTNNKQGTRDLLGQNYLALHSTKGVALNGFFSSWPPPLILNFTIKAFDMIL